MVIVLPFDLVIPTESAFQKPTRGLNLGIDGNLLVARGGKLHEIPGDSGTENDHVVTQRRYPPVANPAPARPSPSAGLAAVPGIPTGACRIANRHDRAMAGQGERRRIAAASQPDHQNAFATHGPSGRSPPLAGWPFRRRKCRNVQDFRNDFRKSSAGIPAPRGALRPASARLRVRLTRVGNRNDFGSTHGLVCIFYAH